MIYTVYNGNGEILYNITTDSEAELIADTPINCAYVQGSYEEALYYIQDNKAILKPANPYQCGKFNYVTKQWELDTDLTISTVRDKRNHLLTTIVDSINAVRWLSFTPEQQQECINYRQALLDVTLQAGYPTNVIWPEVPIFLR